MPKTSFLFRVLCVLLVSTFLAGNILADILPVEVCPKLKKSPMVGDRYSAAEWKEAPPISGFVHGGDARMVDYKTQTVIRCGWTDSALYIAAIMKDPEMNLLREHKTGRDGKIWWDNCLEVFIDPQSRKTDYRHFIINSSGSMYDAIERDKSWNGKWKARVTHLEMAWVLELELPYDSLGGMPSPGELWGISYCRQRPAPGKVKTGSGTWTDVNADHHQPDKFGKLLFCNDTTHDSLMAMIKNSPDNDKTIRIFLNEEYWDLNLSAVKKVNYLEQGNRKLVAIDPWAKKLADVTGKEIPDEYLQQTDKFLERNKSCKELKADKKTEPVLYWVYASFLSSELVSGMEQLYWNINLENSYREIAEYEN